MIAGIGFAGSYAAVSTVAYSQGFGRFSHVFPIGVDCGIGVLLALDLVLTWLRMPFPLLRQCAWLLTLGTIVFNGAAARDALGVGMHATIPMLFIVVVEAARHAVGRIAEITADRHIEPIRLIRWVLAPVTTFRMWRRMVLYEFRNYEAVLQTEIDRLVYRTRLKAKYGRNWRRKTPVELALPLRLARYGVPIASGSHSTAGPTDPASTSESLEVHVEAALQLAARTEQEPETVNPPDIQQATEQEPETVNPPDIQQATEQEPETVNPPDAQQATEQEPETVNPPDAQQATEQEPETVNPPGQRRGQRSPRAARAARPTAVHVAVRGPTGPQRERAAAAASWHAAKAAEPDLRQIDFAARIGRSEAYLSKAIKEGAKSDAQRRV
ncbi:DUF2637 domain-containing protein [Streptacidiphilus sp. EB103A]|uniref:DUF2637 domain-containing protein n=1 Tax=Streptacidiphilus sp. EB103A TaxID=3156275 RepID=UPI0035155C3E